ncbi:hypothetical protein EA462_03635 [Natrarchaeobius halalkaliphilus]|uniref:Putative heavy-metal chelation domain-containing protein n=1 Tax=Natrarchaeobius halalkaliphilus TaxID=1679091 RepID=A0A3N6M6Z6_9EURY|nr:DUF364 domain-containing protein [Natrarchaeobius halalkaliphilus]RQG91101.1 hypothetical protein EA462_03635 [Natrarchaeobius halalkaliphilus]
MTDSILETVSDRLRARDALRSVRCNRVTVGDSVVLVELSDSSESDDHPLAGLAHRPRNTELDLDGTESSRSNRTVDELLEPIEADDRDCDENVGSLERAVAVATVNALSVPFLEWRAGDPMALLDPSVETITTVGLFRPAFRKFEDVDVRVIERTSVDDDLSTPDGVRVSAFEPADAPRAMAGSEVVFVTGSVFVYDGITNYLETAPDAATVVVVGATASFLPGPLFASGVDVVAGATIDEPGRVREAISDGSCGTGLHDAGVRKVYTATDRPSGIQLESVSTKDQP